MKCLLLFPILFICTACGKVSEPLKVNLPDHEIMELVRMQCRIVPRHSGSTGCSRTADLLKKRSANIPGVHVSEDSFTELTPGGNITFRNIIAELPGPGAEFVIIGAHYDAKNFKAFPFEAANDGASGTAAMLVMMKTLSSVKLRKTVRFVFFDGEEAFFSYNEQDGLHGSRHYAENLKQSGAYKQCSLMLLLDMVGDSELLLTLPKDTPDKLVKCALVSAAAVGRPSLIEPNGPLMLDDHVPFRNLGIPSLLLIDFDYGPNNSYWHTPSDTIDNISAESIRGTAETALEILRRNGVF